MIENNSEFIVPEECLKRLDEDTDNICKDCSKKIKCDEQFEKDIEGMLAD